MHSQPSQTTEHACSNKSSISLDHVFVKFEYDRIRCTVEESAGVPDKGEENRVIHADSTSSRVNVLKSEWHDEEGTSPDSMVGCEFDGFEGERSERGVEDEELRTDPASDQP